MKIVFQIASRGQNTCKLAKTGLTDTCEVAAQRTRCACLSKEPMSTSKVPSSHPLPIKSQTSLSKEILEQVLCGIVDFSGMNAEDSSLLSI